MTGRKDTGREVRLPVAGLTALRAAVLKASGPEQAARLLQRAGIDVGRALYDLLAEKEDPASLAPSTFWRRALDTLREHGWGDFVYRARHEGAAELATANGAEVTDGVNRPDCFLSAGLIAGLLAGVDAGPVAVLEVTCRSQGDPECRFLFGGRHAIASVHAALLSGAEPDAALERLG